jgi:hypothetical protein
MTDYNDPKSSATSPTATAAPPPGRSADDGPDPLANLHKMSTTAGVTSQEYVAINIPAIVALVLSLASVVAALSAVLLVIPLAAIITAVVALRQIRDSNGTQTGRAFAGLAIVVSLGIGGYKLVAFIADRYQTQADRQTIMGRFEELGRLVSAKQYDKAYGLFSARFQNRINPETFAAKWEAAQSYPDLGRITAMEWNHTNILFQEDKDSGARVGYAAAWVRFEKGGEPARYTFDFRRSGQKWEIDDAPSVFPPDKPVRRPRR